MMVSVAEGFRVERLVYEWVDLATIKILDAEDVTEQLFAKRLAALDPTLDFVENFDKVASTETTQTNTKQAAC